METQSLPVLIPLPLVVLHRHRRVVVLDDPGARGSGFSISLTIGSSSSATTAIQSHIVDRDSSTPDRRKIPSRR